MCCGARSLPRLLPDRRWIREATFSTEDYGRPLSCCRIDFLFAVSRYDFHSLEASGYSGIEDGSQQQIYWLIAGGCISGCALIVSVVLLAAVRNAGKQEFNALVDNTNGDDEKKKRENDKAPVHPAVAMCNKIGDISAPVLALTGVVKPACF